MKKYHDKSSLGQYPRPDFCREDWESLDGIWEFEFDDTNIGERQRWYDQHDFKEKINVPFCYQSKCSGIEDLGYHPYVWYRRMFTIDKTDIKNVLLHFGAVDYHTKVWINHEYAGEHFGGNDSFCFEIARFLKKGNNEIVVLAEDKDSCECPRGKQIWSRKPERCWYTATTGIWQTVWLEYTGESYFDKVHIIPDIDNRCVNIDVYWKGKELKKSVLCKVMFQGEEIVTGIREGKDERVSFRFSIYEDDPIEEYHYWTPEHPNLYYVTLQLTDEKGQQDLVYSYFGMRKISVKNGRILLNNKPLFQKLLLDQGYWSDSLMTPPNDNCFRTDLELVKEMGFNGVRKHQKIESPRFYYWADILGVLVWEEMPSAYSFSERAIKNTVQEWISILERDYNHPSVITWVTLNESWGVRNIYVSGQQQDYARALYYLTKSIDPTRLVSINDGWEQMEESDLCSVHDYLVTGDSLHEKYSDIDRIMKKDAQGRMLYAENHKWCGQPVILSEFGGIAIGDNKDGWGYNNTSVSGKELEKQYESLVKAIEDTDTICGFCYTQFTDVMQEMNGLLDSERTPKIDMEWIRQCNEKITG